MIIQGVQKKDTLEQNLNFPQKQDFEGTSLSCKGHLKKNTIANIIPKNYRSANKNEKEQDVISLWEIQVDSM